MSESNHPTAQPSVPPETQTVPIMRDPKDEEMIEVLSSDGKISRIKRGVARMSTTMRDMLDDIEEGNTIPIPIPNVTGDILTRVLDYCEYHYEHPNTESKFEKAGKVDAFTPWDGAFIDKNKDQKLFPLFHMIVAANYLDIRPLLEILSRAVAGMIKGKTPAEICAAFNIERVPTDAELDEVRKKNPWLDEL